MPMGAQPISSQPSHSHPAETVYELDGELFLHSRGTHLRVHADQNYLYVGCHRLTRNAWKVLKELADQSLRK